MLLIVFGYASGWPLHLLTLLSILSLIYFGAVRLYTYWAFERRLPTRDGE